MSSIRTKDLVISYENRVIIDHLNIELPKGKITTIIGANGCGKSTVLKAIGRILNPKGGIVYLNESNIRSLSNKEIAKKMAILPQMPQAPEGLSVGELVSYGRFPYQKGYVSLSKEDKEVIQWALQATKLTELEHVSVDNLSGGQRQRVWIAMALAQQTDLILLDEPTTYLDMTYQLEILELLYRLNREQGCTVVMVLHDLNLAARFADVMIALGKGGIIKYGTPEEVMTQEVVRDTFHIDAVIVKDSRTGRPVCISYHLL